MVQTVACGATWPVVRDLAPVCGACAPAARARETRLQEGPPRREATPVGSGLPRGASGLVR